MATPYLLSRVNSPRGYYFDISASRTAYANDHLVYFSRTYDSVNNPGTETIEWDFVSPVAEHNLTSRASSASVRFVYTSAGAEPTSLDSSYALKTTIWDRGRPEGKELNRTESEETHLDNLYFYAGVAARDPGEWTVRETRNGELVDEYTFTVLPVPEPQAEWSRRVDGEDYAMPELVAYTTDEWVARKRTYALAELCSETAVDPEPSPEPDPLMDGDPDMAKNCTILWHWRSEDPALNTNKWGAYLTVKLRYRQNRDATRYKLKVRVFDDVYRGGRLVHFEQQDEPPPAEYTLAYGQGLAAYGDWNFTELHNDQQVASVDLEARTLDFGITADSATVSPDNGATGYTVRLEARPDTWKVTDVTVDLDILDVESDEVVETLTEVVSGNADNPLEVHFSWTPSENLLGRRIMPLPRFAIHSVAVRSHPVLAQNGPVADFGPEELLGEPRWVAQASVAPIYPPSFVPPVWVNPNRPVKELRAPQSLTAASSSSQAWVTIPGHVGRHVDVVNADSRHTVTDMVLATRGLPIVISRTHKLTEQHVAPEFGWRWSFQRELRFSGGDGSATYVDELGDQSRFELDGTNYVPARPDITSRLIKTGAFTYELVFKNKSRYVFDVVPGDSGRATLSREEDRNGNATVYTWNAIGTQLSTIRDPAGRLVTFTWASGALPTSFTDWTGRTVTYEYRRVGFSGLDLLLSKVKSPGNNVIQYGYSTGAMSTGGGWFNSEEYRMLNVRVGASEVQEKIHTDADGFFSQVTNGKGVTTTLERELVEVDDGGGGIPTMSPPATIASASASDLWSVFGAEPLIAGSGGGGTGPPVHTSRLIRASGSDERVWRFDFDPEFKVQDMTDPLNGLTNFGYDPAGNLAGIVNANNQDYEFVWDERRNPLEMEDPLGNTTTLVWSAEDDLERINQPEGVSNRFTYDAKGNMLTAIDAMSRTTTFTYNAAGQLTRRTNAAGAAWNYSYDGNGYLTEVTLPGGAEWTFTVDALGRRTRVIDPRGNVWSYEYDDRDRVTKVTLPDRGALTYEWATYDAGRAVDWGQIRWSETKPANTDVEFQVAVASSPAGPWSFVGPDGTASTKFTDPSGEDLLDNQSPQQPLNGRYMRYKTYLSSDGSETPSFTDVQLSYDGQNTSALQLFSYDGEGNVLEKRVITDLSEVVEVRQFNDLNQIVTNVVDDGHLLGSKTWTFSHDANGNMTGKTDGTDSWTFIWDEDNRLVEVQLNSVTQVEYEYGWEGRLLSRLEGSATTTLFWDGWELLGEEKSGGTTETTRYYSPSAEIHTLERDDSTFQVLSDALFNIRGVVDDTGSLVASQVYDSWGAVLAGFETVPGELNVGFVGGLGVRSDSTTGLIYMRHRWYDPALQRFLSRDQFDLFVRSNLYTYADNGPNNSVDPDGLRVGPGALAPAGGASTTGAGAATGAAGTSGAGAAGGAGGSIFGGLPKINPVTVLLLVLWPQGLGDGTCSSDDGDDDDDPCKARWKLDLAFCGYCTSGRLQDTCYQNARRSYDRCKAGSGPVRLIPKGRKYHATSRFPTGPKDRSGKVPTVGCSNYFNRGF